VIRALARCQTGAAAMRARLAQATRWSARYWAVLTIAGLIVVGSIVAFAYHQRVAAREAEFSRLIQDLGTKLAASVGARKQATNRVEDLRKQLQVLIAEQQRDPLAERSARIQTLSEQLKEAEEEVARIDREQDELQQRIEAAKSASLGGTLALSPSARPTCRASTECRESGRCAARDGICVARSDKDCQESSQCYLYGRCKEAGGQCVVRVGDDCRRSQECRARGRCEAKGGKCIAASDQDCRMTPACNSLGLCTVSNEACIARWDDDCRKHDACLVNGLCVATPEGQCAPRSAADCRKSGGCTEWGNCTLQDGKCVLASTADCRRSNHCTRDGRCTLVKRECVADSNDDCQRSSLCKASGRCTATGGTCL
jgi:hypothetical protein